MLCNKKNVRSHFTVYLKNLIILLWGKVYSMTPEIIILCIQFKIKTQSSLQQRCSSSYMFITCPYHFKTSLTHNVLTKHMYQARTLNTNQWINQTKLGHWAVMYYICVQMVSIWRLFLRFLDSIWNCSDIGIFLNIFHCNFYSTANSLHSFSW